MKILVLTIVMFLLSGCATVDKKFYTINRGDSRESVIEKMGPPEVREVQGKSEAFQYCTTGTSFGVSTFTLVWIHDGIVAGTSAYKLTRPGMCSFHFEQVNWRNFPLREDFSDQKRAVNYKEKPLNKYAPAYSETRVRSDYKKNVKNFTFKKSVKPNFNSYALVIGINNYNENTNVEYADYSALAFEELAHKTFGLPKENIITLLNGKASSGQLKAKLELVKELAEKGSNLYIYFAGHGLPGKDGSTYLLPADMSADSIHLEPNLKLDTIYKRLSQSQASNVFVFMDSCFSGKDDSGDLLYKGVAPVLKTNKVKLTSKKIVVFTAGQSTDFANDFEDKNHRLFSYYLINELSKGQNNLNKAYASIRRDVKRNSLMKGIGYKQVPQLYGQSNHKLY